MALDDYDKFRKKFNNKFRKITKAEVEDLDEKQRKIYDNIVANENIAAVPKNRPRKTYFKPGEVRLREFDSETYKPVKQPGPTIFGGKKARVRQIEERRSEANDYRTDLGFRGATKGYDTESGMFVPTRNPARYPAPREKLGMGGKVCRGRSAQRSAEKS